MGLLLALFGPHAKSDLSPECAPKRTSADHSEFLILWVHAVAVNFYLSSNQFAPLRCNRQRSHIAIVGIRACGTYRCAINRRKVVSLPGPANLSIHSSCMNFRSGRDPIPLSEPPSGGVLGLRTLARNGEFVEPAQADASCPVLSEKIFRFAFPPNQIHIYRVPSQSGAFRDRHGRGCGMRWTRRRRKTSGADLSSLKLRRTGTKTVERLFRKTGADGEVVWS
jgi:hypothetical protein